MIRSLMTAAAMLVAAPTLVPLAWAAEPATKPAPAAKPGAAKPGPAKLGQAKPASPRGPRSAKSLACSKEADGKNLHGAARTSFMRGCNKG